MARKRKRVRSNVLDHDLYMVAIAGQLVTELFTINRDVEYIEDPDEPEQQIFESEVDGIPDVLLSIRMNKVSNRSLVFNLTSLTTEELECFRDSILASVDHVMPVVQELDRIAAEGNRHGATANKRRYRPVPTIRYGDGEVAIYLEGVPHGSEDAPQLEWKTSDTPLGPRDPGSEVADGNGVRSEDDHNTTSASESP